MTGSATILRSAGDRPCRMGSGRVIGACLGAVIAAWGGASGRASAEALGARPVPWPDGAARVPPPPLVGLRPRPEPGGAVIVIDPPGVGQAVMVPNNFFVDPPWDTGPVGLLPDDGQLAEVVVPAPILEAVRQLDSPSWAQREQAALTLRDGPDADEAIMAVLSRESLGPEPRHRLLAILCDRLASAPRGALGIRMVNVPDGQPGVVVEGLLPGMPAEKVLRQGDRIMAIDGRPVVRSTGLMSIIQVERPGRSVRLEVDRPQRGADGLERRDGANRPIVDRIQIDIVLGSSEQLDRWDNVALGGAAWAGVNTGSARTARLRAMQIGEAMARFGAAPVEVAVVRSAAEAPASSSDPAEALPPGADAELRTLMDTLERLDGVEGPLPEPMRERWSATLDLLLRASEDADLSPEARRRLRELAERYRDRLRR